MKTFANGVAVKPTYDAVLNKLQIFLIIAFVFVGFVSSLPLRVVRDDDVDRMQV